jgi:hypothetical protein
MGAIGESEVVLSDAKRLMESCSYEEIFVEGQLLSRGWTVSEDRREGLELVIHFSREEWLWMPEDNPVYQDLKRFWMEWISRRLGDRDPR